MDANTLELTNNLNQDLERTNNSIIASAQNKFLESNLGQVINSGIDVGIKALLPDYLENGVIEIKEALVTQGLPAAIKETINQALELGKNAIGIFTGDFKNITEAKEAIEKGGLVDNASKIIDNLLDKAENNNLINPSIGNIIKNGKDVVLGILNKNVENNIENQVKSINKLNTYIKNWNKAYEKQDFNSMEKEYKKIQKELKNLMPLEATINNARKIENLHNLIKNNGKNFNISQYEKELAEKLA